uniref:PDZ domain-containing protein n=1 Tax=Globisporangium ultimum (strain ATCC 200006 / CBS 805.95 / DAOM BR144) TaxID=431595 RepID=K3WP20_GLOUD
MDTSSSQCDENAKKPETPERPQDTATSHEEQPDALQEYDVALRKGVYGLGIYFVEARGHAIVDPKLPFYRLPDEELAPGEASGVIAPGDVLLAINGKRLETLAFGSVVETLRCLPIEDAVLTFQRPRPLVTMAIQNANQGRIDRQQCRSNQEDESSSVGDDKEKLRGRMIESDSDDVRGKRWSVLGRLSSTAAAITGAGTSSSSSIANGSSIAALETLLSEMESKLRTMDEDLERERKCRFLGEKKNILYRNELLRC